MKTQIIRSCSIKAAGLAIALAAATSGYAETTKLKTGVGLLFGQPTGLTAKFWQTPSEAIDAGLAFSFTDFIIGYGDYLYHLHGIFGSTQVGRQLTPYLGIGGTLFFSTKGGNPGGKYFTESGSTIGFGFRIPLGIEWMITQMPLSLGLEVAPGVGLFPSTFGFAQGGLVVRYYLK